MTAKADSPTSTTADKRTVTTADVSGESPTNEATTTNAALGSPTSSNKSAIGATMSPKASTLGDSATLQEEQPVDTIDTGRDLSRIDTLPRRGSHEGLTNFHKRDSVAHIRQEVETIQQQQESSTPFFHRDFDKDIHVFTEVPHVKVLGGRSEEAWPTRYVEYDVELHYKNFKWQVEIPKSQIYGLWFFIKKQFNIKLPPPPPGSTAANAAASPAHHHHPHRHATAGANWPQMRKLFLATADKSIAPEMIALIQQYLDAVVHVPRLLSSAYVVSMFQVSNSTFDDDEGYTSIREGWLKVRIWLKGNTDNVRINRGAVTCDNECFNCMCVVKRVNFKSKKWRWVALKHSSIAVFPSLQSTTATDAFLFDQKFSIERGVQSAGSNTALLVSNSTYVLQLEAKTKQSIVKWANAIRKVAEKSIWSQSSHRDDSFAIPRHPHQVPSYAKWFVDGKDTYEAMYATLMSAKKEIYVAGWWICPTIHLLRPAAVYPHSRLDLVLQKKAEEGVKVYILMYKEVSVALTLNSNFSKEVFKKLHANVHVLRDPDFLMKHLGMWSHHEKIVSVDQKVSFVGGLDLCFGRYDTHDHPLFDEPGQGQNFVGKDYSNPRVKDFVEVHLPERDMIDRTVVPRMPWHDVHSRLEGQPARDVARHFIQRWNYSVSTRRKSSYLHHLVPMKDYERYADRHEYSSNMLNRRLQRAVRAMQTANDLKKATSLASHDERDEEEKTDETSVDDVGLSHRRGFNSDHQLTRVFHHDSASSLQNVDDQTTDDDGNASSSELEIKDVKDDATLVATRGHAVATQILRSISLWSGGVPTERSIQNAYIRLISTSNHFVYIENQFFVSGLEGDAGCSNRIANALVERIRRAAANNEQFRVMVVMPLLPAFPGKPDDKDASSLRGVMYWQYRSICRGENSIYHTLFRELGDGIDPFEYIAFYGLRTHTLAADGTPTTEEVYVHSKLMIVDDRSVILGSANINERSMVGDRDSEIAVVIDDTEMDSTVKIANGRASVGKFAHSFRMQLFAEHFGVAPDSKLYAQYSDPVTYDAWFAMQDHAMQNAQVYDNVFGCLPSDNIVSYKQLNLPGVGTNNAGAPTAATTGGTAAATANATPPASANNANATSTNPPERSFGSPQLQPQQSPSPQQQQSSQQVPSQDVETRLDGFGTAATGGEPKGHTTVLPPTTSNGGLKREESFLHGAMTTNMRESAQTLKRQHELKGVQGHIVYFPLKFLADEALEPKLFPAELFQ